MQPALGMDLKKAEYSYDNSYLVTKNVTVPAVLIELGYGSNKSDAEKIQSETWLADFARNVTTILIDTYKTGAST